MIQIKNLHKEYGAKTVLENESITIYDGEKIGIIGDNGQGKTTFLNLLTGQEKADNGEIITKDTFGFLKQSSSFESVELLEELSDVNLSGALSVFLKKLGVKDFEFSKERLEKISPGEKTKIALALVLAKNPNVLVLDEPTNHLDILNKDYLEQVLEGYAGTLLLVSHDQDFVKKTTNKMLEIKNQKIFEKS